MALCTSPAVTVIGTVLSHVYRNTLSDVHPLYSSSSGMSLLGFAGKNILKMTCFVLDGM